MKITFKITDGKTWDDNIPLEFDIGDARKLWVELSKIFKEPQETVKFEVLKDITWPSDCSDAEPVKIKGSNSESNADEIRVNIGGVGSSVLKYTCEHCGRFWLESK